MISEESLEVVKAVPLQDVFEHLGVTFKRHFARCPFHAEKSASLHLIKSSNTYFCFGCHNKGSVIDAVMELQSMKFVDAVEWVASTFGLSIEEAQKAPKRSVEKPPDHVRKLARAEVDDSVSLPDDMYAKYVGAPAYMLTRGFTLETCQEWLIGHDQELLRALVPVFDCTGTLRGVSGRLYARGCLRCGHELKPHATCLKCGYTQPSKWLHSDGFKRDQYLFGEVKRQGHKIGVVTEGPFDVMALWQFMAASKIKADYYGVMGSEMSGLQILKLIDWHTHIVAFADGDKAGRSLAAQCREAFGRRCRFSSIETPEGQDPLSLGADACRSILEAELQ